MVLPGSIARDMGCQGKWSFRPVGLAWKGLTMRSAVQVPRRVSLLALLLVLLGSSAVFAAASEPNAVGSKAQAATNPFSVSGVQEALNRIYSLLAEYGLRIIAALVIFVVGRWVAKFVSGLAGKAMKTAKVDPTLIPFLDNLTYSAMLVFVAIAALTVAGVPTTSAVAVLGAAGLAVGLALQGSLSNFSSGVLLLIFKPFRVGDFVEIGGAKGTVHAIHIFNTALDSPDNVRIIVPNGQVTGGSILNYTTNGTRRVDLVASISYNDDIKKAKKVIESVLAEDKRILAEPAPQVVVGEMADSSINFFVRPWVKVADYWDVYFDLTEKLKSAIEEHGMTIPFPQQEITIKSAASEANLRSA
jgi:small conductance mechanosensitive channel